MEYTITFLGIIILMFIADVCWTFYFVKITERKGVQAGIWGALIYLTGAITVIKYMEDQTFIIAAVIGSFFGTWVTVEYQKRKEEKNKNDSTNEES